MSNKVIDGVTYYRVKSFPEGICPYCNRPTLRLNTPVYVIGSKHSEDYICGACVLNRKFQNSDPPAPKRHVTLSEGSRIYIGNKGKHHCTNCSPEYEPIILVMKKNRKPVSVPASQCKSCECFFVRGKDFDKDPPLFYKYEIVEIFDGGEQINLTEEANKKRNRKPGEVSSSLQAAAYKPYQGGRFSGK